MLLLLYLSIFQEMIFINRARSTRLACQKECKVFKKVYKEEKKYEISISNR